MRIITGVVWAGLVGAMACQGAPTQPAPDPIDREGATVLFVGNSLTYYHDMPQIVAALYEAGGTGAVYIGDVSRPNYGLVDHWSIGITGQVIAQGWDVVILRQGPSATEGRPSLLDYSQRFADEIRAAGGVPALYMVWPSRARFFDFDGVADSYTTAAALVDGMLFPVGEAWRIAWETDPGLDLYGPDGFHPSVLGSYLAAVVMYEQLSGQDPRLLPSSVATSLSDELTPEIATFLHEVAAEANARYSQVESTPH